MALPIDISPEENAGFAFPFSDEAEYESIERLPTGAKVLVRMSHITPDERMACLQILKNTVNDMAFERSRLEKKGEAG